jgi:ecdysteroid kinase
VASSRRCQPRAEHGATHRLSTELPIPETLEELTPEWLTAALTETGMLRRGHVTTARWERIGQQYGFTGVVGRGRLRYEDAAGNPPATLIAKLPMAKDGAVSAYRERQERDPALADRYYARCKREARFYGEIPATFAPSLYYAASDDARRRVVLLLEDVGSGRQGDVLVGCSSDDAALVIEELAPFHANWWGRRAPMRRFPRAGTDDPQTRQRRYAVQVPGFLSEYGNVVTPSVRTVVERLGSRLAVVANALDKRPHTLIHGDLHLDNMLFDARSADRSVVVLDWQTVSVGSPARDVSLFLFGSLGVEDRRASEADLFDRYVALLSAHGVRHYSADDLRLDCRLALLLLLAGTVVWLSALERGMLTAREQALQQAALADGRLVAALIDHDAAALMD